MKNFFSCVQASDARIGATETPPQRKRFEFSLAVLGSGHAFGETARPKFGDSLWPSLGHGRFHIGRHCQSGASGGRAVTLSGEFLFCGLPAAGSLAQRRGFHLL
jgi:hypothetical protein